MWKTPLTQFNLREQDERDECNKGKAIFHKAGGLQPLRADRISKYGSKLCFPASRHILERSTLVTEVRNVLVCLHTPKTQRISDVMLQLTAVPNALAKINHSQAASIFTVSCIIHLECRSLISLGKYFEATWNLQLM